MVAQSEGTLVAKLWKLLHWHLLRVLVSHVAPDYLLCSKVRLQRLSNTYLTGLSRLHPRGHDLCVCGAHTA